MKRRLLAVVCAVSAALALAVAPAAPALAARPCGSLNDWVTGSPLHGSISGEVNSPVAVTFESYGSGHVWLSDWSGPKTYKVWTYTPSTGKVLTFSGGEDPWGGTYVYFTVHNVTCGKNHDKVKSASGDGWISYEWGGRSLFNWEVTH
jgi:hypothetical protein